MRFTQTWDSVHKSNDCDVTHRTGRLWINLDRVVFFYTHCVLEFHQHQPLSTLVSTPEANLHRAVCANRKLPVREIGLIYSIVATDMP